jgi:hypothetical protein
MKQAKDTSNVKLTKLSDVQMYRIEDYLTCSESSSDHDVVQAAKNATTTRTTAIMSRDLAADFIGWLDTSRSDAIDCAGCDRAQTDEEVAFAMRSVARSFDSLINKIKSALRKRPTGLHISVIFGAGIANKWHWGVSRADSTSERPILDGWEKTKKAALAEAKEAALARWGTNIRFVNC